MTTLRMFISVDQYLQHLRAYTTMTGFLAGFKNRAPPTVGIKFSEDLTKLSKPCLNDAMMQGHTTQSKYRRALNAAALAAFENSPIPTEAETKMTRPAAAARPQPHRAYHIQALLAGVDLRAAWACPVPLLSSIIPCIPLSII
ncbi:hypothetical protein DFH09DRAFT_1081679 [Mycena vulgaris]|nr:hypothetical protein DFH09DRAFT_1081679 [Mycena vulgaris]